MSKLTQPQLELLAIAVTMGGAGCSSGYAPVRRLVDLGLVTSHEGRFGGHRIEPTEAGIEAFRKSKDESKT